MAVGKQCSHKIVLSNGLQKNLVISFEIQVREDGDHFTKRPLNCNSNAAHTFVKTFLLLCKSTSTEGGQDASCYSVCWVTVYNIGGSIKSGDVGQL